MAWRGRRSFPRLVARAGAALALAATLIPVTGCGGDAPEAEAVRRVVRYLEAQSYGAASSFYRAREEQVLAPEAAPAWRRALEHEDPTVREWAVDALARIGDPEDVPRLVAALDDPFRKVQETAAQGLARAHPETAVEVLVARLGSDDPEALMVGAQVLAEMQEVAAVPTLLGRLRDDSLDEAVRTVVAQALAGIGDPRAAEPLAEVALDRGAGLQLRRTAAEALASLEGGETQRQLQRLLDVEDPWIRELASTAFVEPALR